MLKRKVYRKEVGEEILEVRTLGDEMDVIFPKFMKSNLFSDKELVRDLMEYCINNVHLMQLNRGEYLIRETEKIGFKTNMDSYIHLEHSKGDAIFRTFFPNHENVSSIDVDPFIKFSGSRESFSVIPGNMSDFIMTKTPNDNIIGYTKGFSSLHFGIVTAFLEFYTEMFLKVVIKNEKPVDWERFIQENFNNKDKEFVEIKKEIEKTLFERFEKNRNKRIDLLKVDGLNVMDIAKKCGIKHYSILNSTKITSLALALNKRPEQVSKYLSKTKN